MKDTFNRRLTLYNNLVKTHPVLQIWWKLTVYYNLVKTHAVLQICWKLTQYYSGENTRLITIWWKLTPYYNLVKTHPVLQSGENSPHITIWWKFTLYYKAGENSPCIIPVKTHPVLQSAGETARRIIGNDCHISWNKRTLHAWQSNNSRIITHCIWTRNTGCIKKTQPRNFPRNRHCLPWVIHIA
jgi:hypothetical protein